MASDDVGEGSLEVARGHSTLFRSTCEQDYIKLPVDATGEEVDGDEVIRSGARGGGDYASCELSLS